MEDLDLGAHLVTPRVEFKLGRLYDHHGIYVGDGKVIHYSGFARLVRKGPIHETTLEAFRGDSALKVERHLAPKYAPEQATERARSRLGTADEERYNLFANNCEHFVNWCIEGDSTSFQVERLAVVAAGPGMGAAAGAAAVGLGIPLVAAQGLAGGAAILNAAAWVGGLVGGGVVAGVTAVATVPAFLTGALINSTVLRDRSWHSETEKIARRFGRRGTIGGSVAGAAGGIWSIGAFGAVAGFSGPGIASGLAAIGSLLGGGMAAGAAIAVAAPTLAGAARAAGAYHLAKYFAAKKKESAEHTEVAPRKPGLPTFPQEDEAESTTAVHAALILEGEPLEVDAIAGLFSNGEHCKGHIALALLNGMRLGIIATADDGKTFLATDPAIRAAA